MPLAPCLPLQDLSWTCSTHVQAWAPGAKAPSHPPAGEGVRRRANRERPLVCTQGSKFITSQLAPIARPEESRPGLAEDRRKEDQGEARQTHQRERATDEQPQGEVPVRCAGGEGGVLPSSRREKSRCGAPEGREACCPGPAGGRCRAPCGWRSGRGRAAPRQAPPARPSRGPGTDRRCRGRRRGGRGAADGTARRPGRSGGAPGPRRPGRRGGRRAAGSLDGGGGGGGGGDLRERGRDGRFRGLRVDFS